jgi:hypothetical protein
LSDIAEAFFDRVRDGLANRTSLGRVSPWLQKHTKMSGRLFSFKDHEFQIDIADSAHHDVVVKKPSQVGLTELISRSVLAFSAIEHDAVTMYLLPTVMEAQRAAKARLDPIIDASATLDSLRVAAADSASFKRIGTCQLVMAGTQKPVISIPTDLLVVDELDFCNAENVATAESRLEHSEFYDEELDIRGIRRKWSTPTVPGVGTDAGFQISDQRRRLTHCPHCGHWFWPQWLLHCVIDGWDKPLSELTAYDANMLDQRGLLQTIRLLCEKCHAPLKMTDLAHENREWVAEYPSRRLVQGWHVNPFDLPKYRTPITIARQLIRYGSNTNHFRNFVLGLEYADASNSILDSAVESAMELRAVPPDVAESIGVSGCVAGMDVGKTSWFVVGKPVGREIHVLWAEQIRLSDAGNALLERILYLLKVYGVFRYIPDALPYTPTVLDVQALRPEGWVLPAMYSLHDKKLPLQVVNETDWSIAMHRTKTLNRAARMVNAGLIKWPRCAEMEVVRSHFQNIKRIDRPDEASGDVQSDWVKTGDDHYAHATNYLVAAFEEAMKLLGDQLGAPSTIAEVVVGGRYSNTDEHASVGLSR